MSVGSTPPTSASTDLDAYVERAPTPIYVWERDDAGDFRLIEMNRAAHALSGDAASDLRGRSAEELLARHAGLRDDLVRCFDEQVEPSEVWRRLLGSSGRKLVVTTVSVPPDRVVMHVDDVTDQRALTERLEEELRESEQRFAEVFDAAPLGIAFIGAGHVVRNRFLDVNAAFREMLGRSDDELARLDHAEVTHPDDRERELELAQRLFDGHESTYEIEKRYVRADGSEVWARVRVALLRDDRSRPLYLIAVAADISASKHAHALADRARRTTGAILEHSSDAVIEMRHDGTISEFSPSAVRLFGYERDEVVDRELAELLVPPPLRARQREALARYLETGVTGTVGARYATTAMRADGSEFPAEVTIDVVPGSDPPVFIGSVRSLAAEHALVAARQEADERFERSFRDSATGMALVSPDERLLDVNDALCQLSGRSSGELIGSSWRALLDDDESAAVVAWQGRALAGAGEPLRSRQRLMRADGRAIRIQLVASLIRRGSRVPVHYLHQYAPAAALDAPQPRAGSDEPLTYRERQVLTLLAKGLDGPAIARELGLSQETVRSYSQAARAKLGAATRTHAVALALARGEISL
jgi:PAS domain S-box-containing protein